MDLTGRIYIDGLDAYTTYGLGAEKGGFDDFLKMPKQKGGWSQDWADETGTDWIAPDVPCAESAEVDVQLYLFAQGAEEMLTKLEALRGKLLDGNYHYWDIVGLNRRFRLRYSETTSTSKQTTLKSSGQQVLAITVRLIDDFPLTHPQLDAEGTDSPSFDYVFNNIPLIG